MSTDHKPEDDVELARIEKAGGAVVDGRVQVSFSCKTVHLLLERTINSS